MANPITPKRKRSKMDINTPRKKPLKQKILTQQHRIQ